MGELDHSLSKNYSDNNTGYNNQKKQKSSTHFFSEFEHYNFHNNGGINSSSINSNSTMAGFFQPTAFHSQNNNNPRVPHLNNLPYQPSTSDLSIFNNIASSRSSQTTRTKSNNRCGEKTHLKKPSGGYIQIIAKIILQSPLKKLKLRDIYAELQKSYDFFKESKGKWQNSVRHCLSSNDCFVNEKVNCHSEGKGGYWSVDLKNLPDFSMDSDIITEPRRRRKIKKRSSEHFYTVPREHILKNINELCDATLLVYFPDTHSVDFYPNYVKDIFNFLQKKYNMNQITYSNDFLRKFFRDSFQMLFNTVSNNYDQNVTLPLNEFGVEKSNVNSVNLSNQGGNYQPINGDNFYAINNIVTQPTTYGSTPMFNPYDYAMCDVNKQQFVTNPFSNPIDNFNLYQHHANACFYSKNIAENLHPTHSYNIYKAGPIITTPSNLDSNIYSDEYQQNIYPPSINQNNNVTMATDRNALQFYIPSSTTKKNPSLFSNSEFNQSTNCSSKVTVESSPKQNEIQFNTKLFPSCESEQFHSVKENISNNVQNPLIAKPNDQKNSSYNPNIFNFPQNNNNHSNTSYINPIQSCFNNPNNNKHSSL